MDRYLNTTTAQPNPKKHKQVDGPDSFNAEWMPEADANLNSGFAAVRRCLGLGRETVADLNNVRENPNPLHTQAWNDAHVEDLVGKYTTKLSSAHDSAVRELQATEAALNAKVATAANLKPDAYAPEIRESFKAMKLQDRQAALTKAVEDQDRQILSAVMDAPEIVTGIPAQLTIALREKFNRDVAPSEMTQLDKVSDGYKRLNNFFGDIYRTIPKFYEGLETAKGKEANAIAARLAASFSEQAA